MEGVITFLMIVFFLTFFLTTGFVTIPAVLLHNIEVAHGGLLVSTPVLCVALMLMALDI